MSPSPSIEPTHIQGQRAADRANRDLLVARAQALGPLLARNAGVTETERRAAEANIRALTDAGLFKVMVPQRHGGFQGSVATHLAVTAALAEHCGGTAWVAALTNICAWFAGTLSAQAQQDIFGADPDARVAGVLTPTGTARPVDGGVVVSGKWYWASGSLHATWGFVGATAQGADGQPTQQLMVAMPMTALTVQDTWYTVGMRGSGSNCIVAEEVFVPHHRIMHTSEALQGRYDTPFKDEATYRAALVPVFALVLIGAQLGLGRAALRHVIEKAPQRNIAYTGFQRQSDSTAFQLQVARAATLIDTAQLLANRAADDIDEAAYRGEMLPYTTRARVWADTGWIAKLVGEAIDLLVTAHGAGTFAEANPLQRLWRDANTAARHAMVLQPVGEEIYGKALLGVENTVTPLV